MRNQMTMLDKCLYVNAMVEQCERVINELERARYLLNLKGQDKRRNTFGIKGARKDIERYRDLLND